MLDRIGLDSLDGLYSDVPEDVLYKGDFSIPDASLKGDSAVFELGLAVEPGAGPLTLDAAFTGSAGERDSLGGHLTLLYRF